MHAASHTTSRHPGARLAPSAAIDELDTDVVIIGGGPGGCTAGALLVQEGWRVLLLEKNRHPRFHIGESLLPLSVPLFEQMGCAAAIEKVGLAKHSMQFHSTEHQATQTFAFADAWDGVPKYAYQVKDATLIEPATATGNYSYTSDRMTGDRLVMATDGSG